MSVLCCQRQVPRDPLGRRCNPLRRYLEGRSAPCFAGCSTEHATVHCCWHAYLVNVPKAGLTPEVLRLRGLATQGNLILQRQVLREPLGVRCSAHHASAAYSSALLESLVLRAALQQSHLLHAFLASAFASGRESCCTKPCAAGGLRRALKIACLVHSNVPWPPSPHSGG